MRRVSPPCSSEGQAAWPQSRWAQKLVPFVTRQNGTSNIFALASKRTRLRGRATPRKSQGVSPSSPASGEREYERAWSEHHIRCKPSQVAGSILLEPFPL